jgi:hypothetical protein
MIVLKYSNLHKLKPAVTNHEVKVELRPDIPSMLFENKKLPKGVMLNAAKEMDRMVDIDEIDFVNDVKEMLSNIKFKENKRIRKKSTKISLDDENIE